MTSQVKQVQSFVMFGSKGLVMHRTEYLKHMLLLLAHHLFKDWWNCWNTQYTLNCQQINGADLTYIKQTLPFVCYELH